MAVGRTGGTIYSEVQGQRSGGVLEEEWDQFGLRELFGPKYKKMGVKWKGNQNSRSTQKRCQ